MTAPLRPITHDEVHNTGPRGGAQLWIYLECGHVLRRTLKARLDRLKRARCPHCDPDTPQQHNLIGDPI